MTSDDRHRGIDQPKLDTNYSSIKANTLPGVVMKCDVTAMMGSRAHHPTPLFVCRIRYEGVLFLLREVPLKTRDFLASFRNLQIARLKFGILVL